MINLNIFLLTVPDHAIDLVNMLEEDETEMMEENNTLMEEE